MARRIIDYPEATSIAVDDYAVVGSATLGTRKLLASLLGGGGGNDLVTISETDYQALTTAEKNNGKVYMVEGYTLQTEKQIIPRSSVPTEKLYVTSYYQTGFEGYRAINGSTSDGWLPNAANTNYLTYSFDAPEKISRVQMYLENRNPQGQSGTMNILGSNDGGSTWTTIHSESFVASTSQNVLYSVSYDLSANQNFYKMLKIQGTFMDWAWWLMELNAYTDYEKTHFYYMSDRYDLTT